MWQHREDSSNGDSSLRMPQPSLGVAQIARPHALLPGTVKVRPEDLSRCSTQAPSTGECEESENAFKTGAHRGVLPGRILHSSYEYRSRILCDATEDSSRWSVNPRSRKRLYLKDGDESEDTVEQGAGVRDQKLLVIHGQGRDEQLGG
uniref:Uncharacterized protein n=1 Tax=Timema poppense TaxID=170557 RepID=A0A7R9DJ68_TIMPO|nr:unnamed protein product [Timema poppensis]